MAGPVGGGGRGGQRPRTSRKGAQYSVACLKQAYSLGSKHALRAASMLHACFRSYSVSKLVNFFFCFTSYFPASFPFLHSLLFVTFSFSSPPLHPFPYLFSVVLRSSIALSPRSPLPPAWCRAMSHHHDDGACGCVSEAPKPVVSVAPPPPASIPLASLDAFQLSQRGYLKELSEAVENKGQYACDRMLREETPRAKKRQLGKQLQTGEQ